MSNTHDGWTWEEVKRHYPIGRVVDGTVIFVAVFGVFVDLGVGFKGLLKVPDMAGNNPKKMKDYPQVGQTVTATVVWHDESAQEFVLSQKAIGHKET